MYRLYYDACVFLFNILNISLFPSVNKFFTRHPIPIFHYSSGSESIFDLVGALDQIFFFFRCYIGNNLEVKRKCIVMVSIVIFLLYLG